MLVAAYLDLQWPQEFWPDRVFTQTLLESSFTSQLLAKLSVQDVQATAQALQCVARIAARCCTYAHPLYILYAIV